MVSFELLLYCAGIGGIYLLAITLLFDFLERRLRLTSGIPKEMLEEEGCVWSVMNFFMELLFYVIIPSVAYSFFYLILPLSGAKAGLASALFAFILGAAPVGMRMSVRIKMPMSYMLFVLLSHIVKLGGSLAIIAHLYTL
ncbi:MAG: hypothetical protein NDJ18_09380 [candidate division Zixibacteria bacterium]|nr:hypothetical protein [candidate division Zixibacteria bacterium]